jgi:GntR family transcriptional repressor for pyruvate dehydrogenase complex
LREALRTLEVAGLVESRHGGGTYVRDVFEHGLVPTLALALRATGDVVGDLWEVRGIVEPAIAARAAARATADDLAALEALLAEQATALEHEERLLALDRQFHAALARASGNAVAVRVIELINGLLEEGKVHFMTSQSRRHRAYDRHREIAAAIAAGQPQVARDAMLRHLQEVEEHILGGLAAEEEARRANGEDRRERA